MTGDDWRLQPGMILAAHDRVIAQRSALQPPRGDGGRPRRAAAAAFGRWCIQHGIDPYAYMIARYETIKWRHRLRIDQMASDHVLRLFKSWGAAKVAASITQERIADNVIGEPSTALSPFRERAKQRYALDGHAELCSLSQVFVGGYDARSSWCQRCALAESCRGRRVGSC